MKKISIVTGTALLLFVFAAAVPAQELQVVQGKVIKVDEQAKSVTIKPKDAPEILIIMEDPSLLARVNPDEKAEAKYVIKNGVNSGVKLRRMSEGCEG